MTAMLDHPVEAPLAPPAPLDRNLARDLAALIRPHQWAKNLLVVPLVLLDAPSYTLTLLTQVAWAVLMFTTASSLVYVVNDVSDRHRDRLHPTKRNRPVAAGRISVAAATGLGVTLAVLLVAQVAAGPVDPVNCWPIGAYLALNLVYSRGLKHLPLIDVFVVAVGFVLRAVAGYLAPGAPVSSWLLICVFAVCLLFILGKRRHEVSVSGAGHRPSLAGYSAQYLDYLIVLCATLTVVSFLSYLGDSLASPYRDTALLVSVPFALFAVARYLQVLVVDGSGGEPTRVLLRDRAMVANSVLWFLLLAATLVAAR